MPRTLRVLCPNVAPGFICCLHGADRQQIEMHAEVHIATNCECAIQCVGVRAQRVQNVNLRQSTRRVSAAVWLCMYFRLIWEYMED